MSLLNIFATFILPELGAIIKMALTNPAKYASFKSVVLEVQKIVDQIKADVDMLASQL